MTLRLEPREASSWPKLTWAATCRPGRRTVEVVHGPCVETNAVACVEAVWVGEFDAFGFDQTDLVFGSGIRCRDDRVVFVPSGALCDRLWHAVHDQAIYVSNSLPALLALSGLSLRDDYRRYREDIRTMTGGLDRLKRDLPVEEGELRVRYFHNLAFDGTQLRESPKPDTAPHFARFQDYAAFLRRTARALGENASAAARRHAVTPLAALSRGYDSPAAALLAREAGCRSAVTLRHARSLVTRDDSGERIAKTLGLLCRAHHIRQIRYELEEHDWAANAALQDLNFTAFDYPEPLCLLFTGFNGDLLWERGTRWNVSDPFVRYDTTGLGLSEIRLAIGIFHSPVPFWGIRRAPQIQAISFSAEMDPWSVGGPYDRPIPRRLLEQAGVPRDAFGTRKAATSILTELPWPESRRCRRSLRTYLRERRVPIPPITPLRLLYAFDQEVVERIRNWRDIPHTSRFHTRPQVRATSMLFQWANHTLARRLREGLPERG